MKYFFGILAIIVGVFMVIKTEWFLRTFGKSAWAEEHLGLNGGSRMMYKLLGIVFIVVAMLGMTGMLGTILLSVFGRMFGV
jgi:hypothetical protein